ncbi:superoxide dismutase [Steroidobacter sp. S1-65]|uniref:superoxide dismutase n=1 Tax=Steroidobacter gossypii TaxID=2805490 RepID=A0ABS1WVK1_9GAMM|nr:superoxide dismutase [Steroidobacter gossypii]
MTDLTRREVLQTAALGVAVLATTDAVAQQSSGAAGPAWSRTIEPKPLPFNARNLNGLSEKLVVSHWENNYGGAVKALNIVRQRLRAQLASQDPPYIYNDLKREHLIRTGSVVLHELYFGNLGGDGKAPAQLRSAIARSFGTFDAWESEFRKIGQGLGGGSGWVVLGYNEHLQLLENYWMADHAHNPPHTRPVLVMDMYEHAYHMDFGAAAAKYIDAFFANVNWDEVAKRVTV